MAYAVPGAATALQQASPWAAFRRFALLATALVLAISMLALEAPAIAAKSPNTDAAAPGRRSDAARILHFARSHIGARFRMGAEGQRFGRRQYFDCSGLVYRVFKEAGLLSRIGGARLGATSYYRFFQRRGLANRRNPQPGDLVAYGRKKIHHIGIYVGGGRVISALIMPWGVRSHGLRSIGYPVKAFLHVRIDR